ncbi:MAG: hypothetical protein CML02_19375 [Pseudooceanicola sp.]|jgi:hypothetical protein|nr:hypothetical protein [Pseudooceanicola sp.]
MAKNQAPRQDFNILIVGQPGRLQYECVLFAASLRAMAPDFTGRLFVATPQPGPLWDSAPNLTNTAVLDALERLGATILPFQSQVFGQSYPHGNKIEALLALPQGEPFVFFDSDTLITGDLARVPFDFTRPSASMRREWTWPKPTLYGPSTGEVWRALYDRFDLDFDSSLDPAFPPSDWRHYLYFNAGWFFGPCPRRFGDTFLRYARAIRDDPPDELTCQSFDPWLDQIALPLTIHALGGGRSTLPPGLLDGDVSCHYRLFPLLYARESDRVVEVLEQVAAPNPIKKVLKQYEPIKRLVYQGRGQKLRSQIDRNALPRREQILRKQIKELGFWLR